MTLIITTNTIIMSMIIINMIIIILVLVGCHWWVKYLVWTHKFGGRAALSAGNYIFTDFYLPCLETWWGWLSVQQTIFLLPRHTFKFLRGQQKIWRPQFKVPWFILRPKPPNFQVEYLPTTRGGRGRGNQIICLLLPSIESPKEEEEVEKEESSWQFWSNVHLNSPFQPLPSCRKNALKLAGIS